MRTFTSDAVYNIGLTKAAKTIDWNNGIEQRAVLTGDCTFTLSNPSKRGEIFVLELLVDGTGGYTPVWTDCNWGATGEPSYAANENYLINFYWDGTTYQVSYRTAL